MADRNLDAQFGQIDIYLFDQLLRGRIPDGARVVDAGCGGGRNLVYLLQNGYDVFGVDANAAAVQSVRQLAAALAPHLSAGNFRVEPIHAMTFPDEWADAVISSAVLHFAEDDSAFLAMLHGSWRVLRRGGIFFCRLASSIGIEHQVRQLGDRRFRLPDGSDRYLVDEAMLMELTGQLRGTLLDPIKTTVVQNLRSMTTWVMRKE